MENQNYHEQVMKKNTLKLREYFRTLPSFCQDYFLGTAQLISSRTQLAYAFDLKIFFDFIHENKKGYTNIDVTDYELPILEDITRKDILNFLEYVT